MPSAAEEVVDVVDDHDLVVGSATLAHCLSEGLLHRAVAVLVVRTNGSILLQRRSKQDRWQPGLWTLSCTGHVKRGEAYREAAVRELKEELGLRTPLRNSGKHKLPPITQDRLTEHEWIALFFAVTDAEVAIDRDELEAVKEVGPAELKGLLRGGPLTPDAKVLLRDYLSSMEEQS
jgi:isopentenyldiphosphate isomerase